MADSSVGDVPQVPRLTELAQSRFMQRLAGTALQPNVAAFAIEAAHLLGTINTNMPLYTLHDERHILNVLGWMEWLAGDVIEQLSSIECALCILAAYSHDLGMTLTRDEEAKYCGKEDSPEQRQYQQFLDGFVEEKHEIERLSKSTDGTEKWAGRMLEQHLLTEFLRSTHAVAPMSVRMKARIEQIIKDCNNSLLTFGTVDFRRWLELISLSHNQSTGWLRETLQRENGFQRHVDGQPVNAVFVGLLLRLADIMDFDASRTPTILFHHLGLDRALSTRFEQTSEHEWRKHLAITGTPITKQSGDWTLTYEAAVCDHPAVEKSIREFVGWIEREVRLCRDELDYTLRHCDHKHYALRLPLVKHDIRPQRINDAPVYVFEDWRFQLDQQEIIQLLMGESLYGDPSLCIRELLQNSLDALELRDLRLQLPKSERREPTDGVPTKGKPGFYLDADGNEQRLEVRLTWGREPDDGPWWIKVEDNGVGMTPAVIEKFFTQLGKSFYRSAEFDSEKAWLRKHGLLATPISQFGIGVLSCFMIADRVEVRTCPGGAAFDDHKHPRRPTDLIISGPGSLFWSKPGTRHEQGTEIKLILRRTLKGQPVSLVHDAALAIKALRQHFGYDASIRKVTYPPSGGLFDPAHIASLHVVWPNYPVRAGDLGAGWVIDDKFHGRVLAPLNLEKLTEKATEWDIPVSQLGNPDWHYFDWIDNEGDSCGDATEFTGTRIRIWFARPAISNGEHPFDDLNGCARLSELAALVEPQLEIVSSSRCRVLLNGMSLPAIQNFRDLAVGHVGARVWIDLRGALSPRVTADRSRAMRPERSDEFTSQQVAFENRLQRALAEEFGHSQSRARNLLTAISPATRLRSSFTGKFVGPVSDWYLFRQPQMVLFESSRFETELARARDVLLAGDLDLDLIRDQTTALALARAPARPLTRGLAPEFARDHARAHNLVRALARDVNLDLTRARVSDREIFRRMNARFAAWESVFASEFLQSAFGPSLQKSWPSLELFAFNGWIGDAFVTAPAACRFELELDQRRVSFSDRDGAHPRQLTRLGYDLCYPLTSIPLGRLRRDCPQWRTDRRFQALGMLPLLFPSYSVVWPSYCLQLRKMFCVPEIYALMPPIDLWLKAFADWTADDWANPQHLSILWNIETGDVHYCGGIQTPAETVARGQTYAALIEQIEREKRDPKIRSAKP